MAELFVSNKPQHCIIVSMMTDITVPAYWRGPPVAAVDGEAMTG